MTMNLFDDPAMIENQQEALGDGAMVLRGFAIPKELELLSAIERISVQAPFRHMVTPGGFRMSVAMTNCGPHGWVSDRSGYRYDPFDPVNQAPWPAMPAVFSKLASDAAAAAGFGDFLPDACLINRYEPGARLTLHQDKDEQSYGHPIVSVSLCLPATFQFGGLKRNDKLIRISLTHGDIVVWGGPARLRYHGVLALKQGHHPLVGSYRINLTFRKAS
jgi:DNA oxidative demethylase